MEVKTDGKNLIISVPLTQKIYNPYHNDEDLGITNNLIGIIAGDEYTISQLIDMDYKDKAPQEGMPIIHFPNKEELQKACKIGGIDIWELPVCAYCHKAIRGCYTLGEKGNQCSDCENKDKESFCPDCGNKKTSGEEPYCLERD